MVYTERWAQVYEYVKFTEHQVYTTSGVRDVKCTSGVQNVTPDDRNPKLKGTAAQVKVSVSAHTFPRGLGVCSSRRAMFSSSCRCFHVRPAITETFIPEPTARNAIALRARDGRGFG
ncbi:hypothetical protein Bbelb_385010 [Branchiostoma belcheri]|nr:hypothetical protein Bbelb_385010 [Branchiostoma belcheri]